MVGGVGLVTTWRWLLSEDMAAARRNDWASNEKMDCSPKKCYEEVRSIAACRLSEKSPTALGCDFILVKLA